MTFKVPLPSSGRPAFSLNFLTLRIGTSGGFGPPLLVTALAVLVAACAMLPPVYLAIRTLEGRDTAWDTVWRSSTLDLVLQTGGLAIAVTLASVAISLPLAWLTTRSDLPFARVWVVLLVLPLVFPSYTAAFALVAALGPRGMLQDILEPLGIDRLPSIYGFDGAWFVLTIISYPYVFLTLRAAFLGMDASLEEAARSLGKGATATFLRVTLPNLRPAIAAGAILVALYTLSDFGAVSILRFDSLTSVIYTSYRSSFDRSAAAALSLLLVGLALTVVLLEGLTRGRAAYYSRASRAPSPVRLGRWRWPALIYCGSVSFMGVLLPLIVIAYWAVRGITHGESGQITQGPILNSVGASTLAALVTVAAALPVAFLAVRYRGRVSGALERLTYAGFALPGIAIALSLVFFAANYTPWLYQTMALLVFGYAVRFLPEAVGASRSALLQVNPKTEEAARGLGAGPIRTMFRVTAPQILPGLSAGGLLVFLTAMKELPLTLLLSQIGFETLATQIWTATNEAFFTRAAFASLILVGVSGIAVYLMLRRETAR